MLHSNSFTSHTDDERTECTELLSSNIDRYATDLDVTGSKLTKAQGIGAAWLTALTNARVEEGEKNEAFQEFHLALDSCISRYVQLKQHLLSIIYEIQKPDLIINSYGFDKNAPDGYNKFVSAVEQWSTTHNRLMAESDPRVLPATLMTELLTRRDDLIALWDSAMSENEESSQAFAIKRALYDEDSKFLSWMFSLAKLFWGDDDPRLRMLGFVPASEIWTPSKQLPAPENLAVDLPTDTFTWDEVLYAEGYELQYSLDKATPDWEEIYRGTDRSVVFKPEEVGDYVFRVRAYEEKVGKWSGKLSVTYGSD